MRLRSAIWAVFLCSAAISLSYCALHRHSGYSIDDYETAPVTMGSVDQTISALGKVEPRTFVDVGSQASGQLKRLLVQPGDQIRAGQLLAEVDPQVQRAKIESDQAEIGRLEATLQGARAQSAYNSAELARQSKLRALNAGRTDVYDQAVRDTSTAAASVEAIQAQLAAAHSSLASDRAQLGYTRIYAPIGGTVLSVDVRQGQTINATYSTPLLMRIADLSTVTVRTQVSEADVGRLHPGMHLWFTTLAYGDQRWSGVIRQILPAPVAFPTIPSSGGASPVPQNAGGSVVLYTVLFDVANAQHRLRSGMSAQVFFISAQADNVPVVPMQALSPTDSPDHYNVRVIAHRTIQTRVVVLGAHDRFSGQVVSGLSVGDQVVIGPKPVSGDASLLAFRL